MNRIKGKTILITGASVGIGAACAKIFASHGANLILLARRREKLEALQAQLVKQYKVSIAVQVLDVRERDATLGFISTLKGKNTIPDILLNNAGLASGKDKLHEGDFADWDKMIDTNVKGLLNVSRAVIPLMVERNSGHVVNIGSIAGHQVYPGGSVYNASKYAVRALNEGMSLDLKGTKVRVSGIDPGSTNTEFSLVRFHGNKEKSEAVYQGFTPLSPEDVADAIYYVVNTPEHVNILNMVILPTAQRNVYNLHREK